MSDDSQVGIQLADIGDGGGILHLIGAEHVECQPRALRLAGDDVKQVGGRDAFRQ
jgi:hypothetical protein